MYLVTIPSAVLKFSYLLVYDLHMYLVTFYLDNYFRSLMKKLVFYFYEIIDTVVIKIFAYIILDHIKEVIR